MVASTSNPSAPNQANGGTKSQFVNWEWDSLGARFGCARWPRRRSRRGSSYPQIDRSKPVYFDILVVPVGGTAHSIGAIGYMPDQTNCMGETVTLTVPTNGTSAYTYVWKKGTTTLAGATTTPIRRRW